MKVFWITSLIWIQVTLAQLNTPLQNGCGLRPNLPPNNFPVNQLLLNNGVPWSNVINRPLIGNQPLNQAHNVLANLPTNIPNGLPNNLPNLPANIPNGVPNNLPNFLANIPNGLPNNLPNLPLANRLPQQSVPITNYGNLPQNNFLNNIPAQNNHGNLQISNLPVNNLPYNNFPVTNLPVGNLPIGNNYQINNLPVSNNVPVNNLQLQNNLNALLNNYVNNPQNNLVVPNVPENNLQVLNNLPAANRLQIPNNVQIPLVNNAQYPNLPAGNLALINNLVSSNYLQGFANNVPNNIPIVNYNLPNKVQQNVANTNYLGNINNLQSPNSVSLNNLQLANLNVPNNVQISNRVPVNNLYNGPLAPAINYVPNYLPSNVGQTLPMSLTQPNLGSQYLPGNSQNLQLNQPTSVSFGNNCGCKANAMFLLDDKVANALPSTPVLSLNGLQLEGLGKLPLFNGLPVIGMTESIVNLNTI